MRKEAIKFIGFGGLLPLGACSGSKLFDNNCTGGAAIENPGYCAGTFHPDAGPWAGEKK